VSWLDEAPPGSIPVTGQVADQFFTRRGKAPTLIASKRYLVVGWDARRDVLYIRPLTWWEYVWLRYEAAFARATDALWRGWVRMWYR